MHWGEKRIFKKKRECPAGVGGVEKSGYSAGRGGEVILRSRFYFREKGRRPIFREKVKSRR